MTDTRQPRTTTTQPGRPRASERTVLRGYVSVAAAWYALYLVLPPAVAGPWYVAGGLATAAVCALRVRRLSDEVRPVAVLMLLAGTSAVVGGVTRAVDALATDTSYPFPSPADAFVLGSYVLLLASIVLLIRKRLPRMSVDPLLDAIIGATAFGVLQWTLVVIPYIGRASPSTGALALNLAYSIGSLLLVGVATFALVAGGHRSPANRILAAAFFVTVAVDLTATLELAGVFPGSVRAAATPLTLILGTAGLLHPSVELLTKRPTDPSQLRRLTRKRIGVLALALITPPTLLLALTLQAAWSQTLLPAMISTVLAPIIVLRLGRLVRQNEELAAQEATLRSVGERLVSAETPDDVARIITVGAEQVLGDHLSDGGLVLDPLEPGAGVRSGGLELPLGEFRRLVESADHPVTADLIQLPSPADTYVVGGVVVVQRTVRAALLLAMTRELGDDERNAVESLCRETAIALRAVEQTEIQVRRRSEDRFAALVDNSSDIVAVLDHEQRLLYVSPVATRLLGYPEQQLDTVDVMSLVHRDDLAVARRLLEDVRFGLRDTVEVRLRHFVGTYHWFEIVGVDLSSDPNIGGVILNLREIGDRKRAEERLVLSEARFKALVQNSADLLIVVDEGNEVRYASPSVERVVGDPADAVRGRSLDDLFRDSNVDWSHQLPALCRRDDPQSELFEFRFVDTAGHQHTIETSVADLRAEPAVGGFVLNARDVTERTRMEKQLEYQATHDELTGLGNRVRVLSDLNEILARNSGSTTVAAILVGLDDFKDINDSLGHAAGDRLLVAVSERVTSLLGFGDVAARVGGDTFAVVVERARGETQVSELAEQLLSAVATPFQIDGRELSVTASAGIEFDHDRSHTSEILLRNADIAMFRAKHEGKRRVVVFEPHMHTASFDRLELRADLARAVAAGQLVAHYQPVVEIDTGRITGAEALIRWEHPERGLLGPGLFIPLAEETGLIGPIGQWILDRACADLAQWRRLYGESVDDLTISVNLAVEQLIDGGIVNTVSDILARHGLPASKLVLEVTESTLITDTETIRETMQQLRALGTRLAIDDFGTGYSSLGYIQQFEFDILKIDKSFVDALDSFTNQRIVTAVIELAQQLGVRTIAEGIETQLQADLLGDLHCSFGQGYLYSRPVPERELSELLLRSTDDHARTS